MRSMKRLVKVLRPPGPINYQSGLKIQQKFAAQHCDNVGSFTNYLLLLEHFPVYTIGIRTKGYSEEDERYLKSIGAEFYRTDRGGLITFHGPGQLVAYPIFHLKQFKPSIRWYVAQLEETVIECCKSMGIRNATTTKDTGIWVGNNKICAIGVHGSRYVTTHGIALNCMTDLSWFEHIVPCGVVDKGVTSLSKEIGRVVTIGEAIPYLLDAFGSKFQCTLEWDESNVIKENKAVL